MRREQSYSLLQRVLAFVLVFVMVAGYVPVTASADQAGSIITVADPATLSRPEEIYGSNTLNAGKITVGKSVSTEALTHINAGLTLEDSDNFLVTVSQTAQVAGLATEMNVPVDVVFVLDTSGSMSATDTGETGRKVSLRNGRLTYTNNQALTRTEVMVNTINETIAKLMELNPENRVGVVTFSAHNLGVSDTPGNADNDAAIVLSPLASQSGSAATNHLTYGTGTVNWAGNVITLHGRQANGAVSTAERYYTGGATNIQAGIAKGAQMLAQASLEENNARVPFLIVLSDGAPTVSSSNNEWWDPDMQRNHGDYTFVTDNDDMVEGNSFLTMLTAAYHKNAVSEHYTTASGFSNPLSIYTVGLGLDSQGTDHEKHMSRMTLNPKDELASGSGNWYRTDINTAWTSYANGQSFSVQVGAPNGYSSVSRNYNHDTLYHFYNQQTTVRNPNDVKYNETWVNSGTSQTFGDNILESIVGDGSLSALAYNDDYYDVSDSAGLHAAFESLLTEISQKAISSPTHVATTPEFSGYVTFTDPIGEFMDVKDIKGIYADGILYAGGRAAQYLNGTYTAGSDAFFANLRNILKERLTMTASQNVDSLVNSLISGRQSSAAIRDNSITWWGSKIAGSDESHVQCLGYADVTDDDMTQFIKTAAIPTINGITPDTLCRSYLFYGTASGSLTEDQSNHDYMHFMVRIQQELAAPYRQTVVISAPASLLSVDEVMITENDDGTNTAKIVTDDQPARVVYEVGLRSDINPQNVKTVVESEMSDYADEAGNVDANGQYQFYTNDWDRNASEESHHRAMAKATFNAALDNPFYAYQENELIYVKNGEHYDLYEGTTTPPTGTYYYQRTYYDWTGKTADAEGNYAAEKKVAYIPISLTGADSDKIRKNSDNTWYIAKGTYTASSLVANGEDVYKTANNTGSATIVSHPHRTETASDSHYTVLLGNNGKLSMPYDPPKSVYKTDASGALIEADGKAVNIGETLTYHINVANTKDTAVTAQVIDYIPAGSVYVDGSASHDGILKTDTEGKQYLQWDLAEVAANSTVTLTFQVTVAEDVIEQGVSSINNTATVSLNNEYAYTTNNTTNPPEGKASAATDNNGGALEEDAVLKVGDQLTYTIRYVNDSEAPATVTITDVIPAGTTYKRDSASSNGVYDEATGTITWTIENVPAGLGGTVTFAVYVNASAKVDAASGDIRFENTAAIKIGENDPRYTNKTTNIGGVGDIALTKTISGIASANDVFTLILSESAGKLSGTYTVTGSSVSTDVTFENGMGRVQLKAGETVTVKGLPLGATIAVVEDSTGMEEWKDTYQKDTNDEDGASVVVTAETGKTADVDVSVNNEFITIPVTFQLSAVKKFAGSFPEGSYTFAFQAQQCDENGAVVENGRLVYAAAEKGADNADVPFVFTPRNFDAPMGPLYYLITENTPANPGVIGDDTQYMMKLVIEYETDANGVMSNQLTAKTWYKEIGVHTEWQAFDWKTTSPIVFENNYPADVTTEITGTKTLTGRFVTDGEFSFELLDSLDPENVISNTSVVATGTSNSGTFSFPRTYSVNDLIVDGQRLNQRTFTYYIRETDKGEAGMTYDDKVYQVDVTVKLENGVLSAVPSAITLNGSAVNAVAFTNEFVPEEVSIRLHTTKTTTGDHTLTAGEFTFSVYETDASGNIINTEPAASAANGSDGKVDLGLLDYVPNDLKDASGNYVTSKTFYYVLVENIPAADAPTFDPGMFYDDSAKKFSVTVSINGSQMSAVVSGAAPVEGVEDNYIVDGFTNHRVLRQTSVTPVVQKTTTGSSLPEGLRFSFAVRPATVANGVVTSYSGTAATGVSQSAVNGTPVGVDFSNLVYDDSHLGGNASATYYYVIEESNTAATNGVKYDQTKYVMQVVLSRDAATKELKAVPSYYVLAEDGTFTAAVGTPSFTNKYDADASVNVTATKTLTGRTLKDGEFEFRLQRLQLVDGSYVPMEGRFINGRNDAAGNITFGTINFVGAGLQKQSTADVEYVPATEASVDDAGNPIAAVPEHWLVRYQMSEIRPDDVPLAGVTYDPTTYTVTVKLFYTQIDENTSELNAELVNVPGSGYSFTNSYTPQNEAKVTISATKTMTGRTLRDGEFAFNLYRVEKTDAGVVEHFAAGATNDANGNITFTRVYNTSVLQFPAGQNTYEVVYHLTETDPTTGGVSKVSGDFYVKVVITHDTTTASYTVSDPTYWLDVNCTQPASAVEFVNQYIPAGTSFTPAATKQLLDKDNNKLAITENQFSFTVKELSADGQSVVNASAGTGNSAACAAGAASAVGFTPITVSTAGDHYYEIAEVTGTNAVITYTGTKYYVKATILDDGNGKLNVGSVTYHSAIPCSAENQIADSAVLFTNHQGNGEVDVSLHLDVNKTVHVLNAAGGYVRTHNLTGGEYDFAVYDANGSQVASGTNAAANSEGIADILFENFTVTLTQFDAADTDGDGSYIFTYTVKEVVGDETADQVGVVLDPGTITVKVTVQKDEHKNLSVTNVAYSKNAETNEPNLFVNTFQFKPVRLGLSGTKGLNGKELAAGEFRFKLSGGNLTQDVTVTNNADGTIDFGTLPAFLEPGTFTYTIQEVGAAADHDHGNYQTDPRVTTVVVTVTADVDGNLHAVPMYYSNYGTEQQAALGGIAFSNLYIPDPVELDLNAAIGITKTITDETGKPMNLPLDGFRFELVGITDAAGNTITGITNAQGIVEFPAITFSDDATYTFYIRESDPQTDKPGYVIDPDAWMVEVTVSYNGTLKPINYNDVTGAAATAASGALYIQEGNVKVTPAAPSAQELIAEDALEPAAVTQVSADFTNIYKPEPTNVTIRAGKELTGRDLRDGEFTFRLMEGSRIVAESTNDANGNVSFTVPYTGADMDGAVNGSKTFNYTIVELAGNAGGVSYDTTVKTVTVTVTDVNGALNASVTGGNGQKFENKYVPAKTEAVIEAVKYLEGRNLIEGMFSFELTGNGETHTIHNMADGSVAFAPITYTAAGVYEYTLSEKIPAEPVRGMTYDKSVYKVTVTVTDDLAGKLHAKVAYSLNGSDVALPEFRNSFDGDAGFAEIAAIKVLDTNSNRVLKGGDFSFQLIDAKGNVVETVKNDIQGNVNFTAIAFETAGTYEYTIREVYEGAEGIVYDTAEHKVKVTVVQDAATGHYVATVEYDEGTIPTFTNTFTATPVPVNLEASKILDGRTLKENEFTFELVDAGGNVLQTKQNDAQGNVNFAAIAFEAADTYEYVIREVKGDAEGITYDETGYKATVTVTDTDGILSAEVVYENDGIVFRNTYTGKPVSVELGAKKDLDTDSLRLLKSGEFTFQLLDEKGNVLQTKTNNIGNPLVGNVGSVNFDAIEYTSEGTYVYTIKEVPGSEMGMIYDHSAYEVVVTVTRNAVTGNYEAQVEYKTADGKEPVFVNVFNPLSVEVTITANKELSGRDLRRGEFHFVLSGNDTELKATNNKDGLITFGPIEYNKAGVYEYTIHETAGKESGMEYDKNSYGVTVTVTDTNGVLTAEVDYTDGDIVFQNTYTGVPASAKISAKKSLKTDSLRLLKADEFSFQLIDEEGTVLQTKKNTIFGNVNFDTVQFDAAGEYKFTIKEIPGSEEGMTYDETVHEVTVNVTRDKTTGNYNAEVVYNTADGKEPVFINHFKPGAVLVKPEAEKQLTGRPMQAGEFSFTLYDSNGKKVSSASNNASGQILFDAISFEKAGVYTFTIREDETRNQIGNGTMTFDETVHEITVTVTDTDGVLSADVDYGNGVIFRNTYTGKPVKAEIGAKKSLTGRTLKANEFSFQLIGEDGQVLQTKTNTIFGNVNFDAIEYTAEGEYEYTIREVTGTETGMTYDKTEHRVIVKVVKGATTGDYAATVEYQTDNGEEPVFVNTFKPLAINVNLTATKKLTGRILKDDEFTFTVYDAEGSKLVTGTNNASGKITFQPLTFTQAGIYKLTVKENKGLSWYMTYDRKSYEVTVTITEEDGVLKAAVAYPNGGITFTNVYNPSGDILPQTGDETPLGLLMTIAATSAMGLAAMFVLYTKGKKRKA